jgi:hypothetical protein
VRDCCRLARWPPFRAILAHSRFSGFVRSAIRVGASFDVFVDSAVGVSSEAPQSSQNFAVEEFCAQHFVQRLESGLAHSGQNLLPDVLSVPHLAQRMLIAQLIQQRLRIFQIGGVEALSEPIVNISKHRTCFISVPGIA